MKGRSMTAQKTAGQEIKTEPEFRSRIEAAATDLKVKIPQAQLDGVVQRANTQVTSITNQLSTARSELDDGRAVPIRISWVGHGRVVAKVMTDWFAQQGYDVRSYDDVVSNQNASGTYLEFRGHPKRRSLS
ncbi:hypothetical protein TM7_0088 [candidate division TM7 genomosp. GTL1]|nr:hypothetical protein TM7_0088 [candidate division TM7 genomosp. GTL1]